MPLVKATQELSATVDKQQAMLVRYEKSMTKMVRRLEFLEARFAEEGECLDSQGREEEARCELSGECRSLAWGRLGSRIGDRDYWRRWIGPPAGLETGHGRRAREERESDAREGQGRGWRRGRGCTPLRELADRVVVQHRLGSGGRWQCAGQFHTLQPERPQHSADHADLEQGG